MVRQDDETAKRYIERELGVAICDPFIGLVVERSGQQVGAVILNDYTPGRNIEWTAAIGGPWSVSDTRAIIRYCFARVQRITARTCVSNERAIKMLRMLGFRHEGVMRMFFKEGDAIVFGLLKSEQRIARL